MGACLPLQDPHNVDVDAEQKLQVNLAGNGGRVRY